MPDSPVAISELGAAYYVLNTVAARRAGQSCRRSRPEGGDRITKAKLITAVPEQLAELCKKYHDDDIDQNEVTLPLRTTSAIGRFFMLESARLLPGTTVEFTWQRGEEEMTGKLTPVPAKDWFNSQRGWNLEPMMFVQKAGSFSEAVRWARRKPSTPPSSSTVRCTASWEPARFPFAISPVPGPSSASP